jgi:hypothetical protein
MALEKSRISTVLPAGILALSAMAVITKYGWLAAVNAVYPLFLAALWASVVAIASWGAGEFVTRRLFDPGEFGLERVVLGLSTGTAVLIASTGILAIFHLLHPTLLLVVLAFWALDLYRHPPPTALNISPRYLPPVLILLGATCLTMVAATTFAPFYDQWNYHLGFPYHWLRAGTIVTFPEHAYSFLPSNSGLLYLYALAGPGPWGAQILHWWFGILAAGGSAAVARRMGAGSYGQLVAAVLFVATPNIFQLGSLAGGDLGLAAFMMSGLLAILRSRREPEKALRWTAICGFFAGLAIGCKYTAVGQIVIPLGIVCLAQITAGSTKSERPRQVVLHAAAFCLAFAVVGGPWLVRNVIATGNPVYPYFQGLIQEDENAGSETASRMGAFEIEPGKIATSLTLGTFAHRGQASDIGPVHLWLLPLAAYWGWKRRRSSDVLAVFGVFLTSLAFWGLGPHLGRYLIPTLAVYAALAGAAWGEEAARMTGALRAVFSIALYVFLVANCSPIRGEYSMPQLECALGARDELEYIRQHSTQLDAFRAANAELPLDAKVLLVGEPRPFGIDRDIVVEDGYRTPLLVSLAETSGSPSEIALYLENLGVTHILWNREEAARLAGARGRKDYLECPTQQSRDRLVDFVDRYTHPVLKGGWWEISSLVAAED